MRWTRGPETDVWNIVAGVDLELTDAAHTPWSVSTVWLGGASYFDVSGSLDGGASVPAQTDWKPTIALALVVGYDLDDSRSPESSLMEVFRAYIEDVGARLDDLGPGVAPRYHETARRIPLELFIKLDLDVRFGWGTTPHYDPFAFFDNLQHFGECGGAGFIPKKNGDRTVV